MKVTKKSRISKMVTKVTKKSRISKIGHEFFSVLELRKKKAQFSYKEKIICDFFFLRDLSAKKIFPVKFFFFFLPAMTFSASSPDKHFPACVLGWGIGCAILCRFCTFFPCMNLLVAEVPTITDFAELLRILAHDYGITDIAKKLRKSTKILKIHLVLCFTLILSGIINDFISIVY